MMFFKQKQNVKFPLKNLFFYLKTQKDTSFLLELSKTKKKKLKQDWENLIITSEFPKIIARF